MQKKNWVNLIFLRKKVDFFDIYSAFYGQRLVTAAWATRSPWSINFKSHIIFILTIKELRNFLEFSILCKEILWNQICLEFPRKLKMLKSLSYFNLVPVNLYKESRKHANCEPGSRNQSNYFQNHIGFQDLNLIFLVFRI